MRNSSRGRDNHRSLQHTALHNMDCSIFQVHLPSIFDMDSSIVSFATSLRDTSKHNSIDPDCHSLFERFDGYKYIVIANSSSEHHKVIDLPSLCGIGSIQDV